MELQLVVTMVIVVESVGMMELALGVEDRECRGGGEHHRKEMIRYIHTYIHTYVHTYVDK
jgi:hypothetical protein